MQIYDTYIKRILDVILSLIAILLFAIPMLVIVLIVKMDDPGPAVFKQKRVGKGKTYFTMYKFRSMKMNTPDIPTHLLENPRQYLTRSGWLLRRLSLDELPQLFNILAGQMSIIGPRPALWNQYDLIAERDRYGANDVKPGLTGWAQVNGRDELEIPEKAKLDGDYTAALQGGHFNGFIMDCRIFCASIKAIITSAGVDGVKGQESSSYASATAKQREETLQSDKR